MANFGEAKSGAALNKFGKLAVGAGIATVAAVGVAWANQRTRQAQQATEGAGGPQSMIDWERVRSTAHRMNANETPTAEWREHWDKYYTDLVARAIPIIEEYSHTPFPRDIDTVSVVSRTDWADANIVSFKQMFEPIERLNREAQQKSSAFAQMIMGNINQTVISAEVGLLLGYLGRRVLGQYDLALLSKEPVNGKVFFVEPNINMTVQNMDVNGDEFRLYIALHETTHAFEFESHPWLRLHFNSILEKYFSLITDDLGRLKQNGGLAGYFQRFRENSAKGGGWMERVMTPEQHELFEHLQALMSIIEGYSNHMMNALGSKVMPNYEQIKYRMDHRSSNRTIIDQLFVKLTGMNLKMEQYRLGEIFVDNAVEKKGIDFANLMWADAKYLPTLQEVKNPDLWIARVEKMEAAA